MLFYFILPMSRTRKNDIKASDRIKFFDHYHTIINTCRADVCSSMNTYDTNNQIHFKQTNGKKEEEPGNNLRT